MLNVNIICLGKLKENYLRDACAEYEKRLKAFCKFNIIELSPCKLQDNPSEAQIASALDEEAEKIFAKISPGDAVYPLCIEGKQLTSEELSKEFESCAMNGTSTVDFIIGSSYGLSERVKGKAKLRLSMSKMTFPHQLARVMLSEQIYRAFMISSGGKYHK